MRALNWTVVAAEDDPARQAWSDAANAADVAGPRFLDWDAALASEAGFRTGETVFVERMSGWDAPNPVGGQRDRYQEFTSALTRLGTAVDDGGATLAAPAAPTLLALDRAERDAFLREHGVPVLEPSDVGSAGKNIMRPRFAAADDWITDGWHTALSPHRSRDGFQVRRGPAEARVGVPEIEHIAELLAADGIHAVTDLHRVHLGGDFYDIRFALIDGKVTHTAGVVRERIVHKPWYGGRRRELDTFTSRFGEKRRDRLVRLAERTAALFPGVHSLGVDLCVDNAKAEYVFDVDPFGAELPGAVGVRGALGEGLSVRAAALRALSA
jgi:hypothetical protein